MIQESILIWFVTIAFTVLAFIIVWRGAYADLAWIAALAGFPWTAYGVSQAFYYRKAQKENTKDGIVYETALAAAA